MPKEKQVNWEQRTICQLCEVQADVKSLAAETHRLFEKESLFEVKVNQFRQSLGLLGDGHRSSRDVIRALMRRRNDLDVSLSKTYLQHQLGLEKLLIAIKYSTPTLSFEVKPPVTLLMGNDQLTSCDVFGPDQFGISANTQIKMGSGVYRPTLHLALGLSFEERAISMYVAHDAKLHNTTGLEPVLRQLERVLNQQLRTEVSRQRFPAELGSLMIPQRVVKYLSAESGAYTTIAATVFPVSGAPAIPSHQPLPVVTAMPPDADEVRRIHPLFVLEMLADELKRLPSQFPQIPIRVKEPVGVVTRNPLNPTDPEPIFLISAPVYCLNEFQDEEHYGEIKIGAKPRVRTAKDRLGNDIPDTVEVYLDTFIVQQPSFPFGVTVPADRIPKPAIMKLVKTTRHDPLLTPASMSVTIRYRI